jgi:hypothetical protein
MTLLTERELSRTQFKSMVVMVWHIVENVCKDEAVQISRVKKYDTMFWCMELCETFSDPAGQEGLRVIEGVFLRYVWNQNWLANFFLDLCEM